MPRNIASGCLKRLENRRFVHWPLLDDIPAVGVPFLTFRKEESDVDHRRA